MQKKGFTLVELLIVIGILAILSAATVLILNPAQILQESRDTQRLNDMSTISSALSLYLATVSSAEKNLDAVAETAPNLGRCTVDPAVNSNPFGTHNDADSLCVLDTDRTVTNAGWIDVDLTETSGGSPMAVLPIDPTNSGNYMYAYEADDTNNTFELNTRLESARYRVNMENDGGNSNTCTGTYVDATCWYEVGNDPGLNL